MGDLGGTSIYMAVTVRSINLSKLINWGAAGGFP